MIAFDGVSELKVVDYSLFKQLRVICFGYNSLGRLVSRPQQQLLPSLNVICFPFYIVDNSQPQNGDYEEDIFVAQLLTSRHIPNLKTVGAPMGCWNQRFEAAVSTRSKELWVGRRKELQELEVFTSGKVSLQLLKPGETRK